MLTEQINKIVDCQNFMRQNSSLKIALVKFDPWAFFAVVSKFKEFRGRQKILMLISASVDEENLKQYKNDSIK